MSYLEGVFARGDRQVGRLLEAAVNLGCKFDGWGEHFDFNKWQDAAACSGVDMDAYIRQRHLKEHLPWDHIDCMVDKQYFVDEFWRSRLGLLAEDCRQVKCHQCGVIDDDQQGCLTMLRSSREGRKKEAHWQRQSSPERPPTSPQQKIRFRFAIQGKLRFLSHLETVRVFTRALRRAQLPVQYSQGFHPQPQLAFATALPVGVESYAEYADVVLYQHVDPKRFQERLNAVLPANCQVIDACSVPLKAPSLMSEPLAAHYDVALSLEFLGHNSASLQEPIQNLMARDVIAVQRWHKKGPRQVNIRPGIIHLNMMPTVTETLTLSMQLHESVDVKAKPQEVMQALLGLDDDCLRCLRIYKRETFVHKVAQLIPLLDDQPRPPQRQKVCV
jgi:radical SAM-linked protein